MTSSASDQPEPHPSYLDDDLVTAGMVYWYGLSQGSADQVTRASREAAHAALAKFPQFWELPQNSRAYVGCATRYLASQGIEQILDLGSGLPVMQNTHEVAHTINPQIRVVYVDNDPMTVQHSRDMMGEDSRVGFLSHDVCDIDAVLNDSVTRGLIDLDQPVGLVMASILHLISEEHSYTASGRNTHDLVAAYIDAVPSGSYLAIEHFTSDGQKPEQVQAINDLGVGLQFRSLAEIRRYFDPVTLVPPYPGHEDPGEPDIVWSNRWGARRPDRAPRTGSWIWGGMGIVE